MISENLIHDRLTCRDRDIFLCYFDTLDIGIELLLSEICESFFDSIPCKCRLDISAISVICIKM